MFNINQRPRAHKHLVFVSPRRPCEHLPAVQRLLPLFALLQDAFVSEFKSKMCNAQTQQ
jgi:hypothetical protein